LYHIKTIIPLSGLSKLIGVCILFSLLLSCEKEDLSYSEEPEIQLSDISHDTLVQYGEVLVISIHYQDGDGDLGFEDPDQYALFIRDLRLEDFDPFYVGPLSPVGSSVPIEGELKVEFPSLFLFGNGPQETTRFECKIVDRAGNESNLITTPSVVILRE
jgi:hypothetical protein